MASPKMKALRAKINAMFAGSPWPNWLVDHRAALVDENGKEQKVPYDVGRNAEKREARVRMKGGYGSA